MTTDPPAGGTGRGPLYEPAPWLIVRTPLLPAKATGAVTTANPRDGLADPRVLRALAVASPDLLEALRRPGASTRDAARAELKLARYLIRMSTRPTPYGAFAGVSLAGWGDRTTLTVRNDGDRIRTRPDMGWLTELCLALERDPAVRGESRWTVDTRAVEHHGRLLLSGGGPGPVSVRLTGAVREVLRAARHPVPYTELRRYVLERTAGSPDQVDRLLAQLWQQHLLVTDLRARLTAADPAEDLCRRLTGRAACTREARALAELLGEMAGLDGAPAAQAPARAQEIARRARSLHPVTGPVFQTDMARPLGGGRVCAAVGESCSLAAELLLRLTPYPHGSPGLAAYRAVFTERYGHDREVPVLEMLDERTGIGPLEHAHGSYPAVLPGSGVRRAAVLTDLALTALRDRERVVELDDDTVEALRTWDPASAAAPLSLELSAFVAAASPEAVDRGDFLLVVGPNVGASSAGRSLGRFADLLAPQGAEALRGLGEAEYRGRPDAGQPVEVVYLPENHRMANVVVRPAAHDREIVLDVPPGVPPDRVVPLDDVLVGVRGDRFRLRSRNLGTVLRPTAHHMLNAHRAPAVVRFLDAVSRDGAPEFTSFDWGPAAGFPFLPRMQYGRIVLAPARWLLRPAADGSEGWTSDARTFAACVSGWRMAWSVPPRLYLTMADNRLLLDLDDPRQVEQLRTEARTGQLVLQEALPDTDSAWVPGVDGRFMSEFVVPLVLRPAAVGASRPTAPGLSAANGVVRPTPAHNRTRLPGTDWLFVKFYCDSDREDEMLAGPLRELCEMAEASGLAERWFFIRYADPHPHLRVRWKGAPDALTRHLLPEVTRFASRLTGEGLVSRLVIDTYDRELERYGGTEGTDVSEEIFCADSRAVMRLLAEAGPAHRSADLTELVAVTTDDLLSGLGLSAEDRLRWYSDQARQFYRQARRQGGEDYRVHQQRLRALLGTPEGPALLRNAAAEILRERRTALADAAARLSELAATGRLAAAPDRLFGSYVHLHCNRLLAGRRPSEGRLVQVLQRARKGLSVAPAAR
ncbi:thiopeptide-type bacteriocin biosynthesis protein [Streptomyces sp. TLI_235]|nr:lantibiotic dehydratase [Streptomyces sp. TLI_235]PBC76053.1 thiopeptide-type bacteriocin biosynthesis protein [Streptomyces sp. TLI_235]